MARFSSSSSSVLARTSGGLGNARRARASDPPMRPSPTMATVAGSPCSPCSVIVVGAVRDLDLEAIVGHDGAGEHLARFALDGARILGVARGEVGQDQAPHAGAF